MEESHEACLSQQEKKKKKQYFGTAIISKAKVSLSKPEEKRNATLKVKICSGKYWFDCGLPMKGEDRVSGKYYLVQLLG